MSYNRKINIKKDFSEVNEFTNVIVPMIKNAFNKDDAKKLEDYTHKIFFNQWKK